MFHYNSNYKLISKVYHVSVTQIYIGTTAKQMRKKLGIMLLTLCPILTSLTKDMVSRSWDQVVSDYLYFQVALPCALGNCTISWLMANPKLLVLSLRETAQCVDKIRNEADFQQGARETHVVWTALNPIDLHQESHEIRALVLIILRKKLLLGNLHL